MILVYVLGFGLGFFAFDSINKSKRIDKLEHPTKIECKVDQKSTEEKPCEEVSKQ